MNDLNFTEQELNKAGGIIRKGLEHAKKSFSSIANQNVELKTSKFRLFNANDYPLKIEKEGDLTLLTTAVIGELHGKSYLIFNSEETQEIYDSCLPANVANSDNEKIKEAVLLEIDNIISAAVITEISNELKLKIYGDVPELRCMSKEDVQRYLKLEFSTKQEHPYNMCLWIDSNFVFENKYKINPNFIWRLNEKFLVAISNSINSKVGVNH